MVQEGLHKISVHVGNHNTMSETVSLEDTINVKLSSVIDQYKPISTNIPCNGLTVKGRKRATTKPPFARRQNRMLCSLNYRHDITARENTNLKSSLLPFEELIINNGGLSTKSEYINCSNINFPLHNALNKVDLNTDLLDEVILTKVVLRPTKN